MHFSFSVLKENLCGCLFSTDESWAEIEIFVEYDNQRWDIIFNHDLEAKRDDREWFCELCAKQGNPYRVFSTLEELWVEHLFNPLLNWVNSELAKAEALAICGSIESGATWAILVGGGFKFPPKNEHTKELLQIS
jgi:hypothetical protein